METMSRETGSRKIIVEQTDGEATEFAAVLFQSIVCESVAQKGACCVALSGGTTPHMLYHRLARSVVQDEVPWSSVDVFFGDERDVPQDDVESNYHTVQRALLDHVPIPPGRVHVMCADADDLDAAAVEYERTIREVVKTDGGKTPRFDLILLGMGADGHTASLFPALRKTLDEQKKLVTAHFVPVLGRSRMTFTLPLINAARNVIILVTGADKAGAVAAVLGEDKDASATLPVAGVRPSDGRLFFILDASAAREAGLKAKE